MILIYNVMIVFIHLFRKVKFELLYEYKQNDAFLIILINAPLIIKNVKS